MTISLFNSIKAKLFGLFILAALAALPIQAQIISSVVGGNINLSGKSATTVSDYDPQAVVADSSGNAYFSIGSQIYKFGSNGILALVEGNGIYGYSGDGGQAISAQSGAITGMTIDSSDNLYFSDSDNCVVREVSNGIISTVAGTGSCGTSIGSSAIATELQSPIGLAVDSSSNLYIADSGNCAIWKVSGGTIAYVAGTGSCAIPSSGTSATTTFVNYPQSVAVFGSYLYTTDAYLNVVLKVDLSANTISTVAGGGTGGYSSASGPATSVSLFDPVSVIVDRSGNFYFSELGYGDIRKVDTSGIISTIAGKDTSGYSGDGGPATSALLQHAQGIAFDTSGNLYIADTDNYVIRKISSGIISTVAGNHYLSYSGDGGPATIAQIDGAEGVTVDSSGNRYIADTGNCVIRRVDASTGNISTVAGNGVCGYSADGPALTTKLLSPANVAVDNARNLYIADTNNAMIRKVDTSGNLTTVAGGGSNAYTVLYRQWRCRH
jgi:sugar lactone lactonase YvrE